MMKKGRLIFGLMVLGLGAGCLENANRTPGTSSTILYRHHFLGSARLANATNYAKLPFMLGLPASRELSEQALQKLSRSPQELWRKFLPAGAVAQPALVRPLLDDLVAAESYAEVRGPLHRGESILAIELNDERAGLWRTNLWEIFSSWKLGKPTAINLGGSKGWELKKTESPTLIQFVRAGNWVLIGLGQERLTLLPTLLEQINKSGRPIASQPNVPLDLEADAPRLGDWLPALAELKLPPIHLTLTGKGDYLRTEVRLLFSEPIPWTYEPWKIPTNFVRDPIISFTVGRGIAPLLSQVKGVAALGLKPLPNQFCAWDPGTVHLNTFLSVPMADPAKVLYQIGPKLPNFFSNLLSQSIGGFALITNRNELVWGGWPVLQPHLRPARDGDTDYLLGGLLPMRGLTNRPPPELFAQLKGRTNLAYYHWEITQERLMHAKQLQQLFDIVNHRRLPPTNAPAQKWLLALGPHLGNTITEATWIAPKELTIVRRSDLGLTGFELATLARWVAAPGFPWKFDAPPSPSLRANTPNSKTNAPPPKSPAPGPKKP